ncbi:Com family DNA-binding transcriptional regulator [Fundidesulfovibrio putealis]|uniref:Com family DNA-binding transcriptional regulator n=1 Tax=Fundidesulfovibrio putealis TaxID=270496 RepID=UPI000A038C65|nr:Com family DNA-binding transcriptional regulator [Fundidesulfovibrio putealis]
MQEIRCAKCNRLLAKGSAAELEIKCPRCGVYNHLRAMPSPDQEPQEAIQPGGVRVCGKSVQRGGAW